jgi:hypothetical protein
LYFGEAAHRRRNEADRASELWLGGDKFLLETERAAEIETQYFGNSGNMNRRAHERIDSAIPSR